MAQTNINIRMDDTTKQNFEAICNELGLTMTTAFTIFAKAVIRKRAIPFTISTETVTKESNK
jgi:DNA-damage-inducible protein J